MVEVEQESVEEVEPVVVAQEAVAPHPSPEKADNLQRLFPDLDHCNK